MRLIACALAIAAVVTRAPPAGAQPSDPAEAVKPVEPPSNLPRAQGGNRAQNLDRLFEALKVAPDEESAKYVENRIWAIWMGSTSHTANVLMGRVKIAVEAEDYDLAIKLLNAIIDIKPDFIGSMCQVDFARPGVQQIELLVLLENDAALG